MSGRIDMAAELASRNIPLPRLPEHWWISELTLTRDDGIRCQVVGCGRSTFLHWDGKRWNPY